MKKQVVGGRSCALENSKSRRTDEATWLPKNTTDDGFTWLNTEAYERIQNASTRIAPEQGYEYHRDQRRAAVQDLTRRYFIQIRSGCGNDKCCKALCFNCQSRISHGRVRRPTVLTARMQSFILAADTHSKTRICPDIARLSYHETLEKYLKLTRDDEVKGPSKKDSKSLTQCLFDTAAMKLFQGGHLQRSRQDHLFDKNIDDRSQETRNGSRVRSDGSITDATESAKPRRRNRSIRKLADVSDHERPGQPTAASPKICLDASAVVNAIMSGKQSESTQSGKPYRATKFSKKLSNDQEDYESLGQHTVDGKRVACQQKLQLYGHTRVLRYMNCELLDDIRLLLSLEESQGGLENHLKILHVNASDSVSRRIRHSSKLETFLRQSVHHCLSNAEVLVKSFKKSSTEAKTLSSSSILNIADHKALSNNFAFLRYMTGSLVFDSLWQSLQSLYVPPTEIKLTDAVKTDLRHQLQLGPSQKTEHHEDILSSHCSRRIFSNQDEKPYISDLDAAHIIFICLCALRPARLCSEKSIVDHYGNCDYMSGHVRDESGRRLFHQLIKVIATRRCYWNIQRNLRNCQSEEVEGRTFPLTSILSNHIRKVDNVEKNPFHIHLWYPSPHTVCLSLSSYLIRYFMLEVYDHWDGSDTVKRWGLIGGILELFKDILSSNVGGFPTRRYLDPTTTTANFINKKSNPNEIHILSFGFLIGRATSVEFFRTFNYNVMHKAIESSEYSSVLMNRFALPSMYRTYLNTRLKVAFDRFLTISVRRDHILEDSFNHLWRREKRELLRPLKVIMGSGDGEEGLDQGGVSLEYFRLAVNEALAPDIGMFSIDPISNMAWFQPASLEPLYRYELLGLVFSLAVYNGVTLSINFPMIFYLKLMGANNSIREINPDKSFPGPNSFKTKAIQDGWPQLAKGLDALLSWKEGDVKDVFMRTYDFSFDAYGQTVNVPMKKNGYDQAWPDLQPLSSRQVPQGTLPRPNKDLSHSNKSANDSTQRENCSHDAYVTNANREDYVRDYIYWLTEKSIQKQYEAFAKGFYTCINKKSLSILKPDVFKSLVEGHTEIKVNMLQTVATYEDGYHKEHPLIKGFWQIVGEYDEQSRSQLLEFITASDRIPVNGVESIPFAIVRNGGDCDRIPSAMTCFGKLLLPEYSSVEKLREKLRIALENSRGFGSV